MLTELRRSDLLSADVPTLVLVALAAVAVAAWAGSHGLKRRFGRPWPGRGFLAVRVLLGTAAAWSALQIAARFLMLGTPWSLWATGLVAAASIETAAALYQLERARVSTLTGRMLLALRITLILLLMVMLSQPVLWWETGRSVTRYVAVLLDDSASMHITDRALTPSDKLKLASLFGLKAVRQRPELDLLPGRLADIRSKLAAESAGLQAVPETDAAAFKAFLEKQGASLGTFLQDAHGRVSGDCEALGRGLAQADAAQGWRKNLEDIRARLSQKVLPRLAEAAKRVADGSAAPTPEQRQGLLQALNIAGDELAQSLALLPPALAGMDEALYRGLSPDDVKAVDEIAGRTRARIARDVLTRPKGDAEGMLNRLKSKYALKFVRFASDSVPTDVDAWQKGGEASFLPSLSSNAPDREDLPAAGALPRAFRETTDLGAALDRVAGEATPDSLAGVLVLTDGRHNGKVSPEAAARRLGTLGVPVCTVLIGSSDTPKDAAVVDVTAPVSVYLGDKVNVQASLRLVALRGRTAKVRLMLNGEAVDEASVDVPEDTFLTRVALSHTPKDAGILAYEVAIEPIDGEPLTENNTWPLRVAASDNRMNVLLVEGRPRWEFRYVRNLLYVRDRAVHLQYVLLEPDRLEGAPAPDPVAASASRKFGDAEATALPASRAEWMRFDVIILGDVAPDALDADTLETIQHCVSERGALLVVQAGPRFMPHWHTSPLLRELLPVRYAQTETSFYASPEPASRIRLTAAGTAHPIMQQAGGAEENREIWESFPPITWRHAVASVKEGASVLAYAEPLPVGPGAALAERGARPEDATAAAPLIVAQPYGLGRVVALTYDETWRLRYRKGDVHHHKFWGQLLRWGVGDKLRSGTEHVRIGTDLLTYPIGAPVRIEARVLDMDYKAVTNDSIYVRVSSNEREVIRRQLQYRRDSCGIFEATLPAMPEAGLYRVELESRKVDELLTREGAAAVGTEFVVAAPGTSRELSELSTDLDTPRAMAAASGGKVAGPESADSVLDVFGPGSRRLSEIRELTLWDSWPMLALMVLIITAEWLLRRRKGLV
jgi:hypothetical protein